MAGILVVVSAMLVLPLVLGGVLMALLLWGNVMMSVSRKRPVRRLQSVPAPKPGSSVDPGSLPLRRVA